MSNKWQLNISFLEEGDIFFFYKPKKGLDQVNGIEDISRFYFILDPYGEKQMRFIVLGPKRMPLISENKERAWGFIEKIGGRGFTTTKDQNAKITIRTSRPAGEGIYAIIRHLYHTHLIYSLELPRVVGDVQKTLNIRRQASYIMIIKHPFISNPPQTSHLVTKQHPVNEELLFKFGERRYIPVDPPSLLDNEGSMILMIGVNDELSKLGITVNKDKETEETADIFKQLRLSKHRHLIDPLMHGKWR